MCKRFKKTRKMLKLFCFSFAALSQDFLRSQIFSSLRSFSFLSNKKNSPFLCRKTFKHSPCSQHTRWDFQSDNKAKINAEWEPSQFFLSRLHFLEFKVRKDKVNSKNCYETFFVLCKWLYDFLCFMLKGEQFLRKEKFMELKKKFNNVFVKMNSMHFKLDIQMEMEFY